MYGGGSRLRRHVVKLCGKRFFMRDGFHLTGKGAAALGCECQGCQRGHRYHKLFKLDVQGELTDKT